VTFITLFLAALAAAPGGTFDLKAMPPDYWRNPRRCGPNCLYAYLSIHGHPAPLKAIIDRVPIGADGANMADLRKAATDLGVPSSVVKVTPGRLASSPLPAIAHLQSREGHFVLVLGVTRDTVATADLLSGNVETLPADLFFERWSGYLLVPGRPAPMRSWPLLGVGMAAAAVLAFYRRRPARRLSEVAS
jgi:ABC-type bacteriocin/lantibiotic exporter with double-glycine peptidase domain